jgi:two-component sensor histidine kinase
MDEFLNALDGRIQSMARTHALLRQGSWQGVNLTDLVREELAPCAIKGNTAFDGPEVTLIPDAVPPVAMVLHELVTNAAKYGALSNRSGRVSVRWQWLQNESLDRLLIEWQETGGPPALAPSRSGFGTSIIRELIPFELGGLTELSFAPEGTRCRVEIPGEWTSGPPKAPRT